MADRAPSREPAVDDSTAATAPARRRAPPAVRFAPLVLVVVLAVVVLIALGAGRLAVPIGTVSRILLAHLVPLEPTWSVSDERVVMFVRLPRVLEGMLVGAALASSGAVLQGVFRNPLVNAQVIGLSPGASVGGALALLLGLGSVALVAGAFVAGLATLVVLFAVTRAVRAASPILVVVLAGIVIGSCASAVVSLLTYLADPQNQLPAIVFWLLGSLATADTDKVVVIAATTAVGSVVVLTLRWRLNVLSLGDEEAAALGVRPERLRWVLLTAVAVLVAGAVAVSGVIGWVGLVVPHLARMWVGPDHRRLLPVTLLLGAAYLTAIDTVARTVTAGEIPLGILTALIGAPAFLVLLRLRGNQVWSDA